MKKILFVTYNFPPAAGAGTQRTLKFLKYLPEFGFETYVLTVDKVDYPDLDFSLLNEIPEHTKIFRTRYWTPFGIYRKITGRKPEDKIPVAFIKENQKSLAERISVFLRMNVFLPDAKIGWLPFAVKRGKKIIKEHKIDLIYSSGPPHTCHLIAKALKNSTGVKWIADFRDPWTEIDYYSGIGRTKLAEKIDSYLERSVLKRADYIISASSGYLRIIQSKGIPNKYDVITNGFDLDDFSKVKTKELKKFTITYTGNMPYTRNPENLWSALDELVNEVEDFRENFEFHFAGVMDDEIKDTISKMSFYKNFINHGYVSHNDAVDLVFNSHLLIMIVNQVATSKEILPGKIFEYIASGNYILVIGPEDGESAKLINYIGQGTSIDYNKKDEMKKLIFVLYSKWKKNELVKFESEQKNEFSRKILTGKLADILHSII